MKLTLLYPPISNQERYSSSIGASGGRQIPLGIYYLAAYAREKGHTVQAIDAEAEGLTAKQCVEKISTFNPDVLGISSTTVSFHRALEVASLFHSICPETFLLLGGPHVSAAPEAALRDTCFTAGAIGEGEETLAELLDCIASEEDWRAINGIAYATGGGGVVVNSRRQPIKNLDLLPFPAYDLIPDIGIYTPPTYNYRDLPVTNIITGRGCPNQCTFCDQSIFGRTLRQRSPENIAAEIILLSKQYGIKEISFVDDTFTINFERVPRIFKILRDAGISLPWTCYSRINTITRNDIKAMREMGCWRISFGIESGDPEILKTIKKNIDINQVREVMRWCAEEKIETSGYFMLGHPGETRETIEKTISFALSLPMSVMSVTLNTPFPGSPQHSEWERYGTLDQTDWSSFNNWRPVFIPAGLDQELLLRKQKEFYRKFYFRPRIIFAYLKSFLRPNGFKRFWSLFKALPFLFLGK